MKKIFTIIAALGLERNAILPEWVCFFPEGESEVDDYCRFLVNRNAGELVGTKLNRRGIDIVVDYEHQTLKNIQAPATGWCRSWRYTDGVGIEAKVDLDGNGCRLHYQG